MNSLWMIGASIAFALAAACVKLVAEQGVPTGNIVFFRSLVCALILFAFMRWRKVTIATPNWKSQMLRNIPGVLTTVAYFNGIKLLPLATAVTLNYTAPIFLGLLLIVTKKQPLKIAPIMMLVMGFCGVVLLLQPSFDATETLGYGYALLSGLLGAIYFINIKQLGSIGEPSERTVFYFSVMSSVMMFPWFLSSPATSLVSPGNVLLLLSIGALAMLGQLMLTLAYQRGNALLSASLGYSQIVFSVLLGLWLWNNVVSTYVWLGISLIIGSGILTSLVTTKKPEKT